MTQSARDLENTFERAWNLLLHNWIIIVPGIVFGLVGSGLTSLVTSLGGYVSDTLVEISALIVWTVIAVVQLAYSTGMAGAAWARERARLSDGWSAFTHRGLQITLAMIALMALGIVAAALAKLTFLISLLAYMVFFIYTMASVIIGERGPLHGLGESCRLAFRNVLPTLIVVVLIALIAAAGGWLGSLVGGLAGPVGGAIAGLLQQAIVAYASLVIVGEYAKLRRPAE